MALKEISSPQDWVEIPRQGVTPTYQRRGAERQRALIEAGLRLTAWQDWSDITIAEIASTIGCSVGTFYTRFHTKDAYFDVLLGFAVSRMIARAQAFHEASECIDESASEFVATWVALGCNSFREHRGLYATGLLALRRLPEEDRARSPLIRLRECSRDLFVKGMERHAVAGHSRFSRSELLFAHQMYRSALINAALTDAGPLRLNDPEFPLHLARMLCRYLRIDESG